MHKLQEQLLKLSETTNLGKLSLRKIGKLIGEENAPQKVKHHLLQLERNGFVKINRSAGSMRTVKSGTPKMNLSAVPIMGSVNAGPATIFAEENIDGYLRISSKLLNKRKNIFAVRVYGNSMNRANISGKQIDGGDFAIIDSEYQTPQNGDYVLSVIDNVANIKKYFNDKEGRQIVLMSESTSDYSPIYIHYEDLDKYLVNGRVIQVIKSPKF